jgi:hypothetical protein
MGSGSGRENSQRRQRRELVTERLRYEMIADAEGREALVFCPASGVEEFFAGANVLRE